MSITQRQVLRTFGAAVFRQVTALAPDTVDLPGWTGFRSWILSGHTHGGQCKSSFLPPPIVPVRLQRAARSDRVHTAPRVMTRRPTGPAAPSLALMDT